MEKKISYNLSKYKTSNPVKKYFLRRFLSKVDFLVSDFNPESILDIGCGEGLVLAMLAGKHKFQMAGVDLSQTALNMAKFNVPQARFKKMDATKLFFKDKSFSLTLTLEVLEHLYDYEKAITEAKRVSKKKCIFSVPDEPWFSWMSLLSGMYVKRCGKHPEHINFWTHTEFLNLIKLHFNNVRLFKCFPWTIVVAEV